MIIKNKFTPPKAYNIEQHINLKNYYAYLADYYTSIDFKFDPATYYLVNLYNEEERETYDFLYFLIE